MPIGLLLQLLAPKALKSHGNSLKPVTAGLLFGNTRYPLCAQQCVFVLVHTVQSLHYTPCIAEVVNSTDMKLRE